MYCAFGTKAGHQSFFDQVPKVASGTQFNSNNNIPAGDYMIYVIVPFKDNTTMKLQEESSVPGFKITVTN
jgi:hypothetical protein